MRGPNSGLAGLQQVVADGAHVDRPRLGAAAEVGALQQRQSLLPWNVPELLSIKSPPAAVPPRAHQRRQAGTRRAPHWPPPRTRCMP